MLGPSKKPTLAHLAALVGAGATAATAASVARAKTIAEFVEAPETVAMLREKGVDYSQGSFHGEPRPVVDEFARLELAR